MSVRYQLQKLTLEAILNANTLAGSNVYLYAWPSNLATNPVVSINFAKDVKISNSRTVPNFTTVFTIRLEIRLEQTTMALAKEYLNKLIHQIEVAVLTSYQLNALLQQFAHVEIESEVSSDSSFFVGHAFMDFGMETFEIYQPQGVALDEVTIDLDLQNVYDPTGTYSDPPFPSAVVPAPRTTGPDGRSEGFVDAKNLNA